MKILHRNGSTIFEDSSTTVLETLQAARRAGAYLSGADLTGADLTRAGLSGADLTGAGLSGADLTGAGLSGAYLTGAYLSGAGLSGADLTGAGLSGADLTGADLSGAYLTGADLTRAGLSGADLTGAGLSGADLTGAYLTGAYLTRADLTRAYLTGAYLTGADLTRAYLTGADLTGADLTRADLTGAYLTGAYLTRADLLAVRKDFFDVLSAVPKDVAGLELALREGRVNGSCYEGTCACLVGTIANLEGCNYETIPNLKPDSFRPAERWFLGISTGSPVDHPIVAITLDWIKEWRTKMFDTIEELFDDLLNEEYDVAGSQYRIDKKALLKHLTGRFILTETPESTNIASYGYNEVTEVLIVVFKNGSTYHYYTVPWETYEALTNGDSIGSAFASYIKGKYDYVRWD